jgi:hypothetical protein
MNFKVGDEVICHCGTCTPITITEMYDSIVKGVDAHGNESIYITDFDVLVPLSKLEKAMK